MNNQENSTIPQIVLPKNSAGNYIFVTILIVAIFAFLGSTILLGYKNTQLQSSLDKNLDIKTEDNGKGMVDSTKYEKITLPNVESHLLDTTDWIEQRVERKTKYTGPDDKIITSNTGFSFKYPDGWILQKEVDSEGCGLYTISKENMGNLRIKTICQADLPTYYPVPSDGEIVKQIKGMTVDSSIVNIVRFLSNPNRIYKYSEVVESSNEVYAFESKINDPISFISAEIELQLTDYSQNKDTTARTLLIADTIVASIIRFQETN